MKIFLLLLHTLKLPLFYCLYLLKSIKRKISFFHSYRSYNAAQNYPNYFYIGNAVEYVLPLIKKFCIGNYGLDIGGGKYSYFGRVIEDNDNENAYKIKENDESQDFIISSHTLEHLEDYLKALKEWDRVLKKNGVLLLYLPHPACEIWKKNILKFHKWNPDPYQLETLFKSKFKYKIEYITYLPDGYMSFCLVLRK